MNNYKQTEIMGSTYVRCPEFTVSNPLGETPKLLFREEEVMVLAETKHFNPLPLSILVDFDSDLEIPLIDPETGEPGGRSIAQSDVYAILHSTYIYYAKARDAKIEEAKHEAPVGEEEANDEANDQA